MQKIALTTLILTGLLCGCHTHKAPIESAAVAKSPSDTTVTATQFDMQNTPGHGEELGTVTVEGILYNSKGDMAEVAGMIIPYADLKDSIKGGWKPEYEALIGKNVEVRGEHYRYYCGPMEQCLSGGVINYLRGITYLRAKE